MKKLLLSFVILFSASLYAQMPQIVVVSSQEQDSEFFEIYNKAIELNRETYPDFRKIPVNAPVAFPDYDEDGIIYFPARVPENGKNDCIWYLSLEYQRLKAAHDLGRVQLSDSILDTLTWNMSVPVKSPEVQKKDYLFWSWIFIGLMILFLLVYFSSRRNNRRNINRNPVVRGGLSNNPLEAAQQISALTGSRVVKSEKGRLICAHPVKVQMNFSDGVKRVSLVSGEEYYRITESDGNIRYARRPCGNLINGSIAQLPEGVTFVPSTEENSAWTAEQKKVSANTENEEKSPVINFCLPEENGVAAIVEAAGMMMNVPTKITYKDLVIEFSPVPVEKKEKAEDK